MRKFFAFLLVFVVSFAFAYSDKEIATAIKNQAKAAQIDERVLYTLAKIESGFKPFLISFVSEHNLEFYQFGVGIKAKISPYGNKFIISLSGNKANIIKLAKSMIRDNFNIDVGLMQINSQNFKANEVEKMFELEYNIAKATSVLNKCGDKYTNLASVIECYNKGYRKNATLSYFNRFKTSFLKDFAKVEL